MGRRSPGRNKRAAPADLPPALLGAELDARRTQRVHTVEQFRQGRTPLQVIEVARNAAAVAEGAVQEAMRRVPPRAPSACREGCAWCCYKLVGTSAPEVLRVVAYLRDVLTPPEWQALRERVRPGGRGSGGAWGPASSGGAPLPAPRWAGPGSRATRCGR